MDLAAYFIVQVSEIKDFFNDPTLTPIGGINRPHGPKKNIDQASSPERFFWAES